MSGQVISPEKGRLLHRPISWWVYLGWLLWGLAVAGTMTFLLLRLLPLSASGPLTSLSVLHALAQPMIALVYLAGYLVPVVRRWYIAPTPPEAWKPDKRASNMLEAWLMHLPMALIGLALVISASGALLSANVAPQGVFFALAELGMGVLLFLRSTALGGPMFTTLRGRRWFFGGLALLLVPLYGLLVVRTLGSLILLWLSRC